MLREAIIGLKGLRDLPVKPFVDNIVIVLVLLRIKVRKTT